jgi:hypothetical protein
MFNILSMVFSFFFLGVVWSLFEHRNTYYSLKMASLTLTVCWFLVAILAHFIFLNKLKYAKKAYGLALRTVTFNTRVYSSDNITDSMANVAHSFLDIGDSLTGPFNISRISAFFTSLIFFQRTDHQIKKPFAMKERRLG